MENSSTISTSSKEIDAMLIKIMKDIKQQEELISSMDTLEDIENTIDVISLIEQTLAADNKLADQKLINLKTNLGRAESEKKYLEEIIKAYEDAEKEGSFQTGGISSVKTRLEDANQTINNLKTEIKRYEEVIPEEEPIKEKDETSVGDEVEEPKEITEEVVESIITLNGTMQDGANGQKMSMTINLETGTVSGLVFLRVNNEYIKLNMDIPISGSMNLETREITGKMGEANINGILSADGNSANGTGSSEDGSFVWNVSR